MLVLHPCLRSHWFATIADSDSAAAQEDAINSAEAVFKFVAESYLEVQVPPSPAQTTTHKPTVKPPAKSLSFLASACSFQRVAATTTTATISKRTPREELADELKRYFSFEAAPSERQGDDSEIGQGNMPLDEEILDRKSVV